MINNNFVVRSATREDFNFFFPDKVQEDSMKAWILEKEKIRYALGGVWLKKNKYTAFVIITPGLSLPKKIFWKESKNKIIELLKMNLPGIGAIKDNNIPSSERYLKRLGFVLYDIHDNQEIYKLCNQ